MEKKSKGNILETINDVINFGREKGVLHHYTEDEHYDGRIIHINGKELIHFGSCSYLGLDVDERLKQGAIGAINHYGTQFSSSRTYVSSTLYTVYEQMLRQIFGAPIILTTSVSLGHHAVIPVVVKEGDAIILDQQVHASVQDAALRMANRGVQLNKIRHSNLGELESKINDLMAKHENIWYMVDGIYSMYGDFPPLKYLVDLMNRYKPFHLYLDDAHGMSIAGKYGRGMTLSQIELHPKMILATSLNKAFASGGGVFIFPSEELCKRVMNCGGPLIFSGPLQIGSIGAGIASARIHLSEEIIHLQTELKQRLIYCHDLLQHYSLPVVSNPMAPINFIACGLNKVGANLVNRMIGEGFYVNLAMFPAVPEMCTGVRFTITLHHTLKDIDKLVDKLRYHFPKALNEENSNFSELKRSFERVAQFKDFPMVDPIGLKQEMDYEIQHETTIENIDKSIWNKLIGSLGVNDWEQLLFFERTFSNNLLPEQNWNFHYYIIRDKIGIPLLATFFTVTIAKDDMFAPADVSRQIEETRKDDPYHLSSILFTMGCLLSVGNHLYIDRTRKDWARVLAVLLEAVRKQQDMEKATVLSLRDFDPEDKELTHFFLNHSFVTINLPDGHLIGDLHWKKTEFPTRLHRNYRYFFKKEVENFEKFYNVNIIDSASDEEIDHFYNLYKNVSDKNFEISGFALTKEFFKNAIQHPQWEVLELNLRIEYDTRIQRKAVGMAISYKTENYYHFLVTGIDYQFLLNYQVYNQIIWQAILRANSLKLKNINLGFTASLKKRRFGARTVKNIAYIQTKDSFNYDSISIIANRK